MRFRQFLRGGGQSMALAGFFLSATLCMPQHLHAQTITFPQPDAAVRGTVKVLFEGVPDGGYAMIYLNGRGLQNLREATTMPFHTLNTFTMPEGKHTLTIVAFNASGKRIGESTVSFVVANESVDTSAESIRLLNWTNRDLINDVVRRYRIIAESNVTINKGASGGGGIGGDGMGGNESEATIPAPLDWQVDMLVRRVVRDVGLYRNSANIRSVVQEAFQRQRLEKAPKVPRKKGQKKPLPSKAPWGVWVPSPEMGHYSVKTIRQDGEEINATRKPTTLGLADLLPRFPAGTIQPGSTWQSEMTIVPEIPLVSPINVQAPMTFVSFESIQTPAGVEKRTAKLESRFNLPPDVATRIARSIQKKVGSSGGGGGAGSGGGAASVAGGAGRGGGEEKLPPDFTVVTSRVRRETWFDIEGNQVLRSDDEIETYYEEEIEEPEGGIGGGMGGRASAIRGGGNMAEPAEPQEPTKVTYNLRISKYLDDVLPPPTDMFNNGAGTAHSRDRVQDPSLSRERR